MNIEELIKSEEFRYILSTNNYNTILEILEMEKKCYPSAFEKEETIHVYLKDTLTGEESKKYRLNYLNLNLNPLIIGGYNNDISSLLDDFMKFAGHIINVCLEYSSGRTVKYSTL